MNHELYRKWIASIFVDAAEYVEISDELLPEFIRTIFHDYSAMLSQFKDWQLGYGIDYLFNNSYSNHIYALRDGPAPLKVRLNAIRSIKYLYRDCFEGRCQPALSHLSEPGNDLNRMCYMLWDVTPLTYCEDNPDREQIYDALIGVMEYSLTLNNIACVESGLHGLGHLRCHYKKAKCVIDSFIESSQTNDYRIIEYAKAASCGCIQ